MPPAPEAQVRPSGYASRLYEFGYGAASGLYDLVVWWGMLPFGGERRLRLELADWCRPAPGQRVVSLCCGTGAMERALLERCPALEITGIDLGAGQLKRARRKDRSGRVAYHQADATKTGLAAAGFDRVLIGFALHEMPRALRGAVLREARRLCRSRGLVVAIEHGPPGTRLSRLARDLWWFFWIPGNPEVPTSLDLQRHGLDSEMRAAGLDVVETRVTRPDWIQGCIARPAE